MSHILNCKVFAIQFCRPKTFSFSYYDMLPQYSTLTDAPGAVLQQSDYLQSQKKAVQ